jgi:hypothetical protein
MDPISAAIGSIANQQLLQGWTATGGPSYIALLATKYNKTLIYNYNFASGGATIDANLVQPFQPTVLSLTDQVNNFIKFKEEKNLTIDETSLFSVWIGVNVRVIFFCWHDLAHP